MNLLEKTSTTTINIRSTEIFIRLRIYQPSINANLLACDVWGHRTCQEQNCFRNFRCRAVSLNILLRPKPFYHRVILWEDLVGFNGTWHNGVHCDSLWAQLFCPSESDGAQCSLGCRIHVASKRTDPTHDAANIHDATSWRSKIRQSSLHQ